MKRTSFALSSLLILFASGVWAEPKSCWLSTTKLEQVDIYIEKCFSGDILHWEGLHSASAYIVRNYCSQEKQITVISSGSKSDGVCTYTGKKLKIRKEEDSWFCGPTWKQFCPNESDKCMDQLRYNKFGKEQYCYQ